MLQYLQIVWWQIIFPTSSNDYLNNIPNFGGDYRTKPNFDANNIKLDMV